MEKGFSAGEKKPQTLNLFELIQDLPYAPDRKVLLKTISDIAVPTAEVTTVGNLELEVSKGRNGGRLGRFTSSDRPL